MPVRRGISPTTSGPHTPHEGESLVGGEGLQAVEGCQTVSHQALERVRHLQFQGLPFLPHAGTMFVCRTSAFR